MIMREEELIRKFASIRISEESYLEISQAFQSFDSWGALINLAEQHGLSPLLYHHIKLTSINVPKDQLRILQSLVIRHCKNWEALSAAVVEVRKLLVAKKIKSLLLKGAALAQTIYPDPALRPMCDIDILIKSDQASQAQDVLINNGFIGDKEFNNYLSGHHHLPGLVKSYSQIPVMIELHTMALSSDVRNPISWHRLTEPVATISTKIDNFYTLGHIDTLRLLYGHTFSREDNIRLIGVVDMIGYATTHFEEINWPRIRREFPYLINVFRCLYPLVSIPENLTALALPPNKILKGVGRGMLPLREIINRSNSWHKIIRLLFRPPEWWLHIFYGVAPEKSLLWTRLFKHPIMVSSWLTKRLANQLAGNWK